MSILRASGLPPGAAGPQEGRPRVEPSLARPKNGAVPLPGTAPFSFLALYLGSRADPAGVARDDVEDALPGAERDVVLEAGRPVRSGVQAVERVRQRVGEDLRGDGGVGRRPVQLADEAAGAVRVVEGE